MSDDDGPPETIIIAESAISKLDRITRTTSTSPVYHLPSPGDRTEPQCGVRRGETIPDWRAFPFADLPERVEPCSRCHFDDPVEVSCPLCGEVLGTKPSHLSTHIEQECTAKEETLARLDAEAGGRPLAADGSGRKR